MASCDEELAVYNTYNTTCNAIARKQSNIKHYLLVLRSYHWSMLLKSKQGIGNHKRSERA